MFSYGYNYLPLPGHKAYGITNTRVLRYCCIALSIINIVLVFCLVIPRKTQFTPLDQFQYFNNVPVVDLAAVPSLSSQLTSVINGYEHAVVSSLYSDSYIMAVTTLGHSLKAANVTARMILIYIPGHLSPRTMCRATAAGWTLHPTPLVPPPHSEKGVDIQYVDQYTKLRIWALDSIGIKSLVYLDADTLVRKNFNELFVLPFNFAAVSDIFTDRGFTMSFNAGVLFVRPSTAVFEDMLEKLETAVYPPVMAEQAFLNVYFGAQVTRLPFVYNANLAIKSRSPKLWEAMIDEMRIVHYTLHKPFPRHVLGSRKTMKQFFQERLTMKNGIWVEEMGWWQKSWREMAKEMQSHSRCS